MHPRSLTWDSPVLRFGLLRASASLSAPDTARVSAKASSGRIKPSPLGAPRRGPPWFAEQIQCCLTRDKRVNFFHLPRRGFQKFSKAPFSCGLHAGPGTSPGRSGIYFGSWALPVSSQAQKVWMGPCREVYRRNSLCCQDGLDGDWPLGSSYPHLSRWL